MINQCFSFNRYTGSYSSLGPAKFTKVDASVHELRKMIARVDAEVRKIEMKVKRFDQEARDAVHRKDKVAALSALRKKKRIEREMQDKDVQYQVSAISFVVNMFIHDSASPFSFLALGEYARAVGNFKAKQGNLGRL